MHLLIGSNNAIIRSKVEKQNDNLFTDQTVDNPLSRPDYLRAYTLTAVERPPVDRGQASHHLLPIER